MQEFPPGDEQIIKEMTETCLLAHLTAELASQRLCLVKCVNYYPSFHSIKHLICTMEAAINMMQMLSIGENASTNDERVNILNTCVPHFNPLIEMQRYNEGLENSFLHINKDELMLAVELVLAGHDMGNICDIDGASSFTPLTHYSAIGAEDRTTNILTDLIANSDLTDKLKKKITHLMSHLIEQTRHSTKINKDIPFNIFIKFIDTIGSKFALSRLRVENEEAYSLYQYELAQLNIGLLIEDAIEKMANGVDLNQEHINPHEYIMFTRNWLTKLIEESRTNDNINNNEIIDALISIIGNGLTEEQWEKYKQSADNFLRLPDSSYSGWPNERMTILEFLNQNGIEIQYNDIHYFRASLIRDISS